MVDCGSDPEEKISAERRISAGPFDGLLYSQPFCKLLILQAQISNFLFVFNLLEQLSESICRFN